MTIFTNPYRSLGEMLVFVHEPSGKYRLKMASTDFRPVDLNLEKGERAVIVPMGADFSNWRVSGIYHANEIEKLSLVEIGFDGAHYHYIHDNPDVKL